MEVRTNDVNKIPTKNNANNILLLIKISTPQLQNVKLDNFPKIQFYIFQYGPFVLKLNSQKNPIRGVDYIRGYGFQDGIFISKTVHFG